MLDTVNKYCPGCRATQRFIIMQTKIVCPRCSYQMEKRKA